MDRVPDVVDDTATRAAKALGLGLVDSVFYRAALQAGYTGDRAEGRAQQLYETWTHQGFDALPKWTRTFCELAEKGEVNVDARRST